MKLSSELSMGTPAIAIKPELYNTGCIRLMNL